MSKCTVRGVKNVHIVCLHQPSFFSRTFSSSQTETLCSVNAKSPFSHLRGCDSSRDLLYVESRNIVLLCLLYFSGSRERRRWQRMRWLDGIINSMDTSLNKLWEMVEEREAWHTAHPGVAKSRTRRSDWTTVKALEAHPHCSLGRDFLPFWGWTVFRCIAVAHLVYPFCWWTCGWFQPSGCCPSCYLEHVYVSICFRPCFHFFWGSIQKCNRRVTWSFLSLIAQRASILFPVAFCFASVVSVCSWPRPMAWGILVPPPGIELGQGKGDY